MLLPRSTHSLLPIIEVLRSLPLKSLTIRVYNDLGNEVWERLHELEGLTQFEHYCVTEKPVRFLQGWSERLGPTLEHLQLSVRWIS